MSREGGRAGLRQAKKYGGPPEGRSWIWFTDEMLESDAWRAMTPAALAVVHRVCIEHMAHAGTQNGDLAVSYDDFEAYGIRRKAVWDGIAVALALGFLDQTEKGIGYGSVRRASRFALTWIGRRGEPPTNRWKAFQSREQAERAVVRATAGRPKRAGPRTRGKDREHAA